MKLLHFFFALTTCILSLLFVAAVATPPSQEEALALWVKNKLTIDQIIKNANQLNKNMNPYEGIACSKIAGNYKYELMVHPDQQKMASAKTPAEESKNLLHRFEVETEDKSLREAVEVDYTYEGRAKKGIVYRIDPQHICVAFWVVK
jgi:hypothetical protein